MVKLVWILSLAIPFGILLPDLGTCTQGEDLQFIFSLVISFFGLTSLVIGYYLFRSKMIMTARFIFIHISTLIAFLVVVPDYLIWTTSRGYHLCCRTVEWSAGCSTLNSFTQGSIPRWHYFFGPLHTLIFLVSLFVLAKIFRMKRLVR